MVKQPDPATRPIKIERLKEAQKLRIQWADGHTCEMDYHYLRQSCPCASCSQSPQKEATLSASGPSLQIEEISLVGTYAVTPVWSDGHDTGIYSFRFLRELCPHEGKGSEAPRLETFGKP
jgi:DUF971 family protein